MGVYRNGYDDTTQDIIDDIVVLGNEYGTELKSYNSLIFLLRDQSYSPVSANDLYPMVDFGSDRYGFLTVEDEDSLVADIYIDGTFVITSNSYNWDTTGYTDGAYDIYAEANVDSGDSADDAYALIDVKAGRDILYESYTDYYGGSDLGAYAYAEDSGDATATTNINAGRDVQLNSRIKSKADFEHGAEYYYQLGNIKMKY